jgi:DNA polymerase II small subunit/DNA polymerase delta subunit B
LIGNVKPVSESSNEYRALNLTKTDPDWVLLTSDLEAKMESEEADMSFQSQKTGSVISLNSTCRNRFEQNTPDLRQFTDVLFMGVSVVDSLDQKNTSLASKDALQTTLVGWIDDIQSGENQEVKIQALVLHHGRCVYDLMYFSTPTYFDAQLGTFNSFLQNFKLSYSRK